MKEIPITFENQGQKIVGILQKPDTQTSRIAILAHGFTGSKEGPHSGLFPMLSKKLVDNGFAVLRIDFRGTGESDGYFVDMTVKDESSDLVRAIDFVKEIGYEKIGIIGESMGGTVSVTAYNEKINCMVLWYPAIWLKDTAVSYYIKEKGMKELETEGWLTYVKTRTGEKFKLGKEFISEVLTLDLTKNLKKIQCPILFIHGDDDPTVSHTQSEKAINLVSSKIKSLETIKGGNHTFDSSKEHKQKCVNLTVDWFDKWLK